jgi:hypothetical protein
MPEPLSSIAIHNLFPGAEPSGLDKPNKLFGFGEVSLEKLGEEDRSELVNLEKLVFDLSVRKNAICVKNCVECAEEKYCHHEEDSLSPKIISLGRVKRTLPGPLRRRR